MDSMSEILGFSPKSILPKLADGESFYDRIGDLISKSVTDDETYEARMEMLARGELPPGITEEKVEGIVWEILSDDPCCDLTLYAPSCDGPYPVSITSIGHCYWVKGQETDPDGPFLAMKEAREFAEMNWVYLTENERDPSLWE